MAHVSISYELEWAWPKARNTHAAVFLALGLVLTLGASDAFAQTDNRPTGLKSVFLPKVSLALKSWFSRVPVSMELARDSVRTPRDVCSIVERRIRYRHDRGDEWQTPEQTLARRSGDCEDFAILVQQFCENIGYPTALYLFFSSTDHRDGHAVAAGRLVDGRWWYADNGAYHEADDLEAIRRAIAKRSGWDPDTVWYAALDITQVRARIAGAEHNTYASVASSKR